MSDAEDAGSSDAIELRWLKAAFAVNIVVFAVAILLIQLDPLQQQANRGYFVSPEDELNPGPQSFLPISTVDEAIGIANGRLPDFFGTMFVRFAHSHPEFHARLKWNHEWGNIYYWELTQNALSIAIDATTGEVVFFSYIDDYRNGTIPEAEAYSMAYLYVERLIDLPDDASAPRAEYVLRSVSFHYNETSGEMNATEFHYWIITFNRVKDGLPADDHIKVVLDPYGRFHYYRKVWNMELEGVVTGQEVSNKEALDIARSAAEGANITSVEHRIARPTGGWPDGPKRYGDDPVSVWRMTFEENNSSHLLHIDINDRTGEIVGSNRCC